MFSNENFKQTALRDCDANHLFYPDAHMMTKATKESPSRQRTPEELKKVYRSFQKNVQRSKTVSECFLQHSFINHPQEYNCFLKASNLFERSSTFNELFRVAWKSFQLKLKKTNRKRIK